MHVWLKSIIIIVLDYCTFVQLLPFVRTFEGKIQCFETIITSLRNKFRNLLPASLHS
jgi:hypothetical protein